MDSWSKHLSDPVFVIKEQELSLAEDQNYPNAFGELVLIKNQFMEWTFEVTSTKLRFHIPAVIGIIEADKAKNDLDLDFRGSEHPGMGFYLYTGKIYRHTGIDYVDKPLQLFAGQETVAVKMTLDLTLSKGILSYKTGRSNDEGKMEFVDHGIAFDDIDANKSYRMAICFWERDLLVQMLP